MRTIYTGSLKSATFLLLLLLASYSSCKKDNPEPDVPVVPEPTAAEKTTTLIKGAAWVMSGVTVDGVVMDLYKNLNISFTADANGSNGKYTSVNGGVLWPATGTWKYKTDEAKAMIRDDGLEISIDAITDKTMTISFTRTGDTVFEGGRGNAVGGKHVLTLAR